MRRVDAAMAEERVEKDFMREVWVAAVSHLERHEFRTGYMTLCGANAREIEMLIERGVIRRSESGAIHRDDGSYVVAVESSPNAVLQLKLKYPGLAVIDQSIHNVIKQTSSIRYPEGVHLQYCSAPIINLDFDGPLHAAVEAGSVEFPDLDLVYKLAMIHRDPLTADAHGGNASSSPRDWTLFLTFCADLIWNREVQDGICDFLNENFSREPVFAEACGALLGEDLMAAVKGRRSDDILASDSAGRQRLLMCFVPKKVAHIVHLLGWRVRTERNYRYGNRPNRKAMVTWEFALKWDPRSSVTPDLVYREALRDALSSTGMIDSAGNVVGA